MPSSSPSLPRALPPRLVPQIWGIVTSRARFVHSRAFSPDGNASPLTPPPRPKSGSAGPVELGYYSDYNGAVFASGPSARPGLRIIAGEAIHEGIAFCADGVCRAAQFPCHLAGTAESSRPRGHDAELPGRAGRV